jgi:hypothetical protein
MTMQDIIDAIDSSARERIAKCFDVLCSEYAGHNEEYQRMALQRFMAGVKLATDARDAAVAAMGSREEQ